MPGSPSPRPRHAATAMMMLVSLAPLAVARADDDPFAMLRERGRAWTFELVSGPSLGALVPVEGAPQARCQVAESTPVGPRTVSRIECAPVGDAGPDVAPALTRRLQLILDDDGVRESAAATDDPSQLAEDRLAGAFTFPRELDGRWGRDFRRPDGAHSKVQVHREVAHVGGARAERWIAESTYHGPRAHGAAPAPVLTSAAFAPGIGPALLCTAWRGEGTTCLRLVEDAASSKPAPRPRPVPQLRVARKTAHAKSSLSAVAVAGKITGTYLAGIRRCYADGLRKKPALRGALVLDFTVNAVGKLSEPSAKFADEALAGCVRTSMAGWRFPIPMSEYSEPRDARFTIELRLAPE